MEPPGVFISLDCFCDLIVVAGFVGYCPLENLEMSERTEIILLL
jgi:hypothetical protein